VVALVAQVLPVAVVICPALEQGDTVIDLGCWLDAAALQALAAQRFGSQQTAAYTLQSTPADSFHVA